MLELLHRSDARRRRALRLRGGAPRRRPQRGDRRPQRRASTRSTARRRRASACACRSAAAGASPPRATSRAPAPRRRWPARSPSPRRSPRRADRAAGAGRAGARALGLALRARPVRRRAGGQARAALRRRGGAAHRRRAPRAHGRQLPRVARAQGLRLDRGRGLHAGDGGHAARASSPTPPTAATCRCAPTRPPTAAACAPPRAGSTSLALDLAGNAPRVAEEAIALLTRAAVPGGHEHDRAARRAGGAPGPRVDRARARARPHPARRGLLRGHELGRRPATSARCATAPSCCTSPPTRRCPAAWARSAGTTRASPPCAPTSSRAACCAARCPTARAPPPIGLERLRRLRARRRLRPPADRAHDQRLARARRRVPTLADLIADTDDGLYLETNRSWSIDDRRLQFQFATELCREIRGGELGRLYRNGSYAGVTPRFWGSLDAVCGPGGVAAVGADQLRQGRARAGHGRLARRRARALSRRAGRRRVTRRSTPLELAERALGFADGEAQATVVRERSLLSRFARLAPDAGHRGRRPHGRDPLRPRRPHRLGRRPTRRPTTALRDVAARAGAAARAPRRRRRRARATTPGLPGARRPRPRHDGFDAATAQLDPGAAGERPERRPSSAARPPACRPSGSGPRARSTPRSPRRPACARSTA